MSRLFKLHTKWPATGDQPEAIKKLAQELREGMRHQTLFGATDTEQRSNVTTTYRK